MPSQPRLHQIPINQLQPQLLAPSRAIRIALTSASREVLVTSRLKSIRSTIPSALLKVTASPYSPESTMKATSLLTLTMPASRIAGTARVQLPLYHDPWHHFPTDLSTSSPRKLCLPCSLLGFTISSQNTTLICHFQRVSVIQAKELMY